MRNLWLSTTASILAVCVSQPVSAQIVITPRFSAYFDNSNQRQSGLAASADEQAAADARLADAANATLKSTFGNSSSLTFGAPSGATKANQDFFPMFGASITVPIGLNKSTQLTFTALYGTAHSTITGSLSEVQTLNVGGQKAEDIFATDLSGRGNSNRLDLELTAQHRINETFSLIGGVRLENERQTADITSTAKSTNNSSNLLSTLIGDGSLNFLLSHATGVGHSYVVTRVYSLRAGGAAYIPIGERQLVYVNGLVQISYAPTATAVVTSTTSSSGITPVTNNSTTIIHSEITAGPDISVGYVRKLSERISLDLRYRGIFYFPISGPQNFKDPRVNHGANIGISFSI